MVATVLEVHCFFLTLWPSLFIQAMTTLLSSLAENIWFSIDMDRRLLISRVPTMEYEKWKTHSLSFYIIRDEPSERILNLVDDSLAMEVAFSSNETPRAQFPVKQFYICHWKNVFPELCFCVLVVGLVMNSHFCDSSPVIQNYGISKQKVVYIYISPKSDVSMIDLHPPTCN